VPMSATSMDVDVVPFDALKLFASAPVYDLVFALLSPRTLARVALACRAAYVAVAAFKSRAFNINHHFSRYFADPLAFRSLQAKTNTLVSGSDALQFLDRTFYPSADLDLYTHPGHSLEVAHFLVESEGYKYVPRESQEPEWEEAIGDDFDGTLRRTSPRTSDRDHAYPVKGIEAVWTFEKIGRKEENFKVQIVEATSSPLEVILGFHSTTVMNFISSDAAYSLYPIATFEERSGMGMPSAGSSPSAIQKYTQRGWRTYFIPTPYHTEHPTEPPFFLDQARWVGDHHTWVMPLDQTGVKKRPPLSPASAPLTFDPVLCNGWKMSEDTRNPSNGCDTNYYPLRTTLFRYNYAIPVESLAFSIRTWATLQGKHAHSSVDKADWVWFDGDVPFLLRKK